MHHPTFHRWLDIDEVGIELQPDDQYPEDLDMRIYFQNDVGGEDSIGIWVDERDAKMLVDAICEHFGWKVM